MRGKQIVVHDHARFQRLPSSVNAFWVTRSIMNKTGTRSSKARLTLVASYLLLAALVAWAATAPLTLFTGSITAVLVLGCWMPGYMYANWHDLRSNRVFWMSHGLAFVVAAILWLCFMPSRIDVEAAIQAEARRQNSWFGIGIGVLGYIGFNFLFRFLAHRVFSSLRDCIEKRLGD